MKTPPAKNFFPCMSGMSLCPAFRHRLRSLWYQFFGTIALMEFVLKISANSSALLASLAANEAMHVPWPRVWKLWQVLGAQFFGTIVLMKFILKKPCQQLCIFSVAPCQRSYACPIAQCLQTTWKVLGAVFRDNRIDGICPRSPILNFEFRRKRSCFTASLVKSVVSELLIDPCE